MTAPGAAAGLAACPARASGVARATDPGPAAGDKRALSLKLSLTARQVHARFDRSVAAIGITRSQWTAIAVVARYPGVTQREAAEMLQVSEASAGRLIDRLCGDGLLVRRPKEDDRRAHCIHLTDAAGPIMESISRLAMQHEETAFADLDQDDLARLATYLDRIAANVAGSP